MLGEFEYLLLTAAVRLGEDAYGAAVRLEIENSTGRRCSIGALYTTLDRRSGGTPCSGAFLPNTVRLSLWTT